MKNQFSFRNSSIFFSSLLLLLVNYKFLYFVQLPGNLGARANLLLYVSVSLVLNFMFIFIIYRHQYKFNFTSFIILLTTVLIIETFYSLFMYPNEPIIKQLIPYLALLSYYIYSVFAQENINNFLNILIIFSIAASLICIFELIINLHSGLAFFKIYGYNYGVSDEVLNSVNSLRNGRFRLIGCDLIEFTAILSMGSLFQTQIRISRKLAIVNILCVLVYDYFVSQVRSMVIYLIATMCILYFIKGRLKFIKSILCFAGTISLYFIIKNIINKLDFDYSYSNRINEVIFYIQRFLGSHFMGNGLLPDEPLTAGDFYLVHGPGITSKYSYSDIGIIGVMGCLGIMGLVLYFILIRKFYFMYNLYKNAICLAITIIVLFSIINLSLLDGERLVVLSVLMAVCDGINFDIERGLKSEQKNINKHS